MTQTNRHTHTHTHTHTHIHQNKQGLIDGLRYVEVIYTRGKTKLQEIRSNIGKVRIARLGKGNVMVLC